MRLNCFEPDSGDLLELNLELGGGVWGMRWAGFMDFGSRAFEHLNPTRTTQNQKMQVVFGVALAGHGLDTRLFYFLPEPCLTQQYL